MDMNIGMNMMKKNRKINYQSSRGEDELYKYDKNGNLISFTNYTGKVEHHEYDKLGNRIYSIFYYVS